ncbi:NYN domain-containing protein [Mycobacterium sp. 5-140-3-2]|uniref:NYN domain-containing protein n=1 Tax=unclassified Mycobacterium TaxID=2642494 RepID=UPI002D7713AF|nr:MULTISPECIES: NYN domain-containing protein [unclassified Mycobacterium]WRU80805.1 NYN domain-containing protein [Mycobacterium sp. 5-140-3-2]WSE43042.1 NYN domain-containing protein [Mycobacterium sp. 5-140-3-1]
MKSFPTWGVAMGVVVAVADTLAVYVDGFNLYHGLHEASGCKHLWLDVVALAQSLRPQSTLIKVMYFTAPVLNDPRGLARQQRYLAALTAQNPGVLEVVQGRYQQKNKKCLKCGNTWRAYEEKETDVNIAINLVADAANKLTDAALIISADSDLAPGVRLARQLNPNPFVAAAFPPKRVCNELKTLMPRSFHVGMGKIRNSQLPPIVVDAATSKQFTRPTKWT